MEDNLQINSLRFLTIGNSFSAMFGGVAGIGKNNLCYGCFNTNDNKLFDF